MPQLELTTFTAANLLASLCHSPNPLEQTAIVALLAAMVGGLTVMVPLSAITTVGLASIIVQMIMAGASTEAIAVAIAVQLGNMGVSVEVVSKLVENIQRIMGC